ncbi:hypothetical protein GCM10027436_21270 [Actinophytocola sediminis]
MSKRQSNGTVYPDPTEAALPRRYGAVFGGARGDRWGAVGTAGGGGVDASLTDQGLSLFLVSVPR